jgi:hypothetical protein
VAGFINSLEAALLDLVFGKATYTAPANWFVGLSSTTPTETGTNFTEPSGGAYARVSTAPANWNAATGGDPSVIDNSAVITFPTATADWASAANLTHFGLFTAATGGTVQMWGALTTAKNVLNGDTASFAAGALDVKLGDPGDPGL